MLSVNQRRTVHGVRPLQAAIYLGEVVAQVDGLEHKKSRAPKAGHNVFSYLTPSASSPASSPAEGLRNTLEAINPPPKINSSAAITVPRVGSGLMKLAKSAA